jgi:hypothetical protein
MTCRFAKLCVMLLCGVFAIATFAQNSNSHHFRHRAGRQRRSRDGRNRNLTNVNSDPQSMRTVL